MDISKATNVCNGLLKKNLSVCFKPTILVIIFWQFSAFLWKFDSPQVKRDLISSMINFLHELPYELPKDMRLRKLGN